MSNLLARLRLITKLAGVRVTFLLKMIVTGDNVIVRFFFFPPIQITFLMLQYGKKTLPNPPFHFDRLINLVYGLN